MYAPGVKSVIMAMLLVWSAPAVRAISWVETIVCNVEDWVLSLLSCSETCTTCREVAISRGKWSTGDLPRTTEMDCS